MGAPRKTGLDYFRRVLFLPKDRKFRPLKYKFGFWVPMIYEALLDLIYDDKGYYLEYGDKKEDVICDVLENLQGKFQPSAETVSDVIDGMVEQRLFSSCDYPKIITSKRAQAEYYYATTERKAVEIDFGIWLLDEKEMSDISTISSIFGNFKNRPIKPVKRTRNTVNRSDNPQSKEAERKGTERKATVSPCGDSTRARTPNSLETVIQSYTQDALTREMLREWLKVRKVKHAASTEKAVEFCLDKLAPMAQASDLSIDDYLREVISRGWASFYEIRDFSKKQNPQAPQNDEWGKVFKEAQNGKCQN